MTSEAPTVDATNLPESAVNANKELRTWADTVKDQNKALRDRIFNQDLAALGLKPDQGLGKALAKEYRGSYEPGDLAKYAKEEYGYVAPEAAEGGAQATEPAPPTDPKAGLSDVAQRITETAPQVQQLSNAAVQTPPVLPTDPVAAAQEALLKPEATKDDASRAITVKMGAYRTTRE